MDLYMTIAWLLLSPDSNFEFIGLVSNPSLVELDNSLCPSSSAEFVNLDLY